MRQISFFAGGTVLAYSESAWSDESGFLLTQSWLAQRSLEPISAAIFEAAWDSGKPTNNPAIKRIRPAVPAGPEEIQSMVENQLEVLPWPDVAESIREHLVAPTPQWRRWDYGESEEILCWLVASWPELGWGIAYCSRAHAFDWGIVELHRPWFGMDSGWWGLLVEAAYQGGFVKRPSGYQRWINAQPSWQKGREVEASQDPEDLMDGVHLDD